MATETVTISKEEYELLLEEVGILRNPKMVEVRLYQKGIQGFDIIDDGTGIEE